MQLGRKTVKEWICSTTVEVNVKEPRNPSRGSSSGSPGEPAGPPAETLISTTFKNSIPLYNRETNHCLNPTELPQQYRRKNRNFMVDMQYFWQVGKSNRNPCEQPEGKTTPNRLRLCNQTRTETHTEKIDSFSRITSSNEKMGEILREIT